MKNIKRVVSQEELKNMQRKYEHAFNKIIRDISEDKIGTQVLLYGDEKFLIDWAKKQLIERYK